ncbi:MAG: PAS domain S-box protein [Thermoguttaceae bacterium]
MNDSEKNREQLILEVTEMRDRVAKLETSKNLDHYRTLAESTSDIVYILDKDGSLLYANRSAAERIGISQEALVGKKQEDLFPPEMARLHLERIRRIFETAEAGERDELFQFGPKKIWLNVRSIPLKDEQGRVVSVMGVCRDVTDRKQAEEALRKAHDELEERVTERTAELSKTTEALRRSEERFRSYFELGLMGMAVSGRDRRWLEINDRLCEILGYSRNELLQKNFSDLMHPGDRKAGSKTYQALMAGEIDNCTVERRYIRKDGNVVYLTVFAKSFHSEDGKVDHILALFEDVTQHKKAQQALQKEHRTLKHLLQSSDHERQLIAYEIHDGLAQQLAGAIMQFQIFDHLKETKPGDAAKAYNAGVTMLHQGHFEARRLIHGVRPPILDESGVVEAVAHLVHEESRQKGPKIEFQSRVVFDRLAPILENAIYRIIQEALTNARIHSKSKKVRVGLLQKNEHVRIVVRDWGIGFSPDDVKENCYGLEGIRERARLLGGKCSIRTVPGKGTQISVELPLVARD